jgi:hypothetical protein
MAAVAPEKLKEYEALLQTQFAALKGHEASKDWKEEKKDGDLTLYRKDCAGSSFKCIKSEIIIEKPYDAVLKHAATVKQFDRSAPAEVRDGTFEKTLTKINDSQWDEGFLYYAVESPSKLVSHRDFLTYRKHFEENGKHYFMQTSIVNDDIKAPVKGFVRANISFNALIVEQHPKGAKLVFIAHADPCGSVPSMIYNSVSIKQGYTLQKLKDSMPQ